MSNSTRAVFALPRAHWRETTVLLAAGWLVPLLVHLAPWAGPRPLGVYVLPVFWTTFLAVYFHGAALGLLVGLVTPAVNLLITGLPAMNSMGSMSLEVACFVAVAAVLAGRWPNFRLAAPVAWVAGKTLALTAEGFMAAEGFPGNLGPHLLRSTQNGLAGLGVLALINVLLVAFCPKGGAREKE